MTDPIVVAVDGPAGAGKSAVGRRVAEELGLPFVDSGLFYRAVAWLAHEGGVASDDVPGLVAIASLPDLRVEDGRIYAGDRDLSSLVHRPEINDNLSAISQVPEVRDAINERQRRLAEGRGVVMAGRDIRTVVFSEAPYKFFLTASLPERVRRRLAQKARRGEWTDDAEMEREIAARDVADSTRAVAPLRPAPDAVIIDTDGLAVEEVVERIVQRVRR
ncbi:MAG TPA: (d)CMP kinase [Candidatus Dormibacteraeota bacterium]